MLTLKAVNKEIQKKYPGVILEKGKGYFYIYSEDEDHKLHSLFTRSIGVNSLNQLTMEQWLSSVDYLFEDNYSVSNRE